MSVEQSCPCILGRMQEFNERLPLYKLTLPCCPFFCFLTIFYTMFLNIPILSNFFSDFAHHLKRHFLTIFKYFNHLKPKFKSICQELYSIVSSDQNPLTLWKENFTKPMKWHVATTISKLKSAIKDDKDIQELKLI